MLAFKEGDRVRLVSRQGKDHTRRFQGLEEAVRALRARSLVLDGEVARYDALISRFEWLRSDPGVAAGHCVTGASGSRNVLDGAPALLLPVRHLADGALKAWQQVLERGYEGRVAKDRSRPMWADGRSSGGRSSNGFYDPKRP
jgi:ATP-dependent DNA ligase